jgi:alpha-tubulin suppressor-like RCC1 family protein
LRRDGTLWAWGDNTLGKLGGGRYTKYYGGMAGSSAVVGTSTTQEVPLQIGQHRWQSISVNRDENLGIRRDGTLWLWGASTGESAATMHSWGGANRWHSVATNKVHSLAIRVDRTLWAWGDNKEGQLGDSTLVNWRQMPVKIGHAATWVSVATNCYDDYYSKNYAYSIGLQADGTLWAWGDNTYGQLGDGTTSRRRVPVRLPMSR